MVIIRKMAVLLSRVAKIRVHFLIVLNSVRKFLNPEIDYSHTYKYPVPPDIVFYTSLFYNFVEEWLG
ncbi:MAG: hypothetical protein HQ541_06960 [Mariniphaga sp.]|nr:hypothetical protein [Mariniphaga sp.]